MTRYAPLSALSALIFTLPATIAHADLTAADVWADWKDYMSSAGYQISATEASSGGRVTVTDMSMAIDVSDDNGEGTVGVVLDEVVFSENGDGSVSITLPETSAIEFAGTGEEGEDIKITVDYTQSAPTMTATGSEGEVTYDYAADALAMRLASVNIDGIVLTEQIAKFVVTLDDVSYVTRTAVGDLRSIAQEMSAAALNYDVAFRDPEGEGSFTLLGAMEGLSFDGSGDLPAGVDTQDVNQMLDNGFAFEGTFAAAGGSYDLSFEGPDGSGTVNSSSTGGELVVGIDPDGLTYGVEQTGVSVNMLLTELPLPISFSAATTSIDMQVPVQKSDETQDFALAVTLQEFAMSDMIWGLFDPAGQLPRDPATLVVDLSGKAKLLFDFLDPAQAAVLEQADAAPGELNALTLNKLELDAVGARLTGEGDFTFDNGDLTTFDGMPRPLGGMDLTLVGGNGLIDKLVGMGLLPEEQAMGARMMMGLFAVPGEGEDTLNSRIEVNEQGHVLANGQRLR